MQSTEVYTLKGVGFWVRDFAAVQLINLTGPFEVSSSILLGHARASEAPVVARRVCKFFLGKTLNSEP